MGWHVPENLRLKRKGKEYCIFDINIVDITCYGEKNRDKIHGERKGDVKRG